MSARVGFSREVDMEQNVSDLEGLVRSFARCCPAVRAAQAIDRQEPFEQIACKASTTASRVRVPKFSRFMEICLRGAPESAER